MVFAGYRLRPDLTADALVDGRFVTSDLGRIDEVGPAHGDRPHRRRHRVRRGERVGVTGGARARLGTREVRACAVVGRPDEQWGERVVAVVQAVRPDDAPTLDDLRDIGAGQLEPAALPKELVVLGMLPMLASGKPDRAAVRTLVAERAGQR